MPFLIVAAAHVLMRYFKLTIRWADATPHRTLPRRVLASMGGRSVLVVVAVSAVGLCCASMAATVAAAPQLTCASARGHLVRGSRTVFVFGVRRRDDQGRTYVTHYACASRAARPLVLDHPNLTRADTDRAHLLRAAGRYLAYADYGYSEGGGGERSADVILVDLRSRRASVSRAIGDPPIAGEQCPSGLPEVDRVSALVLNRHGAYAWIAANTCATTAPPLWEVRLRHVPGCSKDGSVVLDSGRAIAPRSLTTDRRGRFVFWTDGGGRRSARLR